MFMINIAIGGSVDKIISARQSVTLTKTVNSFASFAADPISTAVAWQVFQPIENNTVSWIESYSLYATTVPLNNGNVLTLDAVTAAPAIPGFIYTFSGGPLQGAPGKDGMFNLSNEMGSGSYSFGLAQSATVNNQPTPLAPLNATPMLFNQTAQFTPPTTVAIFLSTCTSNGTVIPGISANALVIPLSSASSTVNVGFNDDANTFFLS